MLYFKTDTNNNNGINKFIDTIKSYDNSDIFHLNYINVVSSFNLIRKSKNIVFNFPSIPRYIYPLIFFILILKFRSERILIVHEYDSQSKLGRKLLLIMLRFVDKIYCVDQRLIDVLVSFNLRAYLYVQAGNLREITRIDVNIIPGRVLIYGTFNNFDLNVLIANIRILLQNGFSIEFVTVDFELVKQMKLDYDLDIIISVNVDDEDLDLKILQCEFAFLPYKDGFSLRRSTAINCLVRGTPLFTLAPLSNFVEFDENVLLFYIRFFDISEYYNELRTKCLSRASRDASKILSRVFFKGGQLS
jgi:hypothetical protein